MSLPLILVLFSGGCAHWEQPDLIIDTNHMGGSVIAFAKAETYLASAGRGGRVRLWRLPSGENIHTWRAHDGSVNGIGFFDGDDKILTAGYDGALVQWDLHGRQIRNVDALSPVTAMAIDDASGTVITGHMDGAVRRWRLPSLSLEDERRVHDGMVRSVAWAPGEHFIASGGADGQVFWWSQSAGPQALPAPPTDAWSLIFSPDGGHLLGGGWFKLFRWTLSTRQLRTLATDHWGLIKSLRYTPNGGSLVSISRQTDSSVLLLDPNTGATLKRFGRHRMCGFEAVMSRDGGYLASSSDDSNIHIWKLKTR